VEFYNRKEIRDVLAYLKILVNPNDEIALLRIINTPARGIGKTTIDRVRSFAAGKRISFFEALKKAEHIDSLSKTSQAKLVAFINMLERFKKDVDGKIASLAEWVFNESGLAESLRSMGNEDAIENVNELINSAAEYEKQVENPTLLDYLQQISLFSDVDAYDTSSERVALMTLHAAKGLEFENVFIIGLEEGLLPHEKSNTNNQEDLEEERRLFFVGITRAKVGLYISYAQYRTKHGQMLRTIPSQFLFELGINPAESDSFDSSHLPVIPAKAGIYDSMQVFTEGQIVLHKTFGTGRVKEFIDMGENSIVKVKFNNGQIKSLMVKYADLSTI
jgi:DNA helicase-2/ATP-dependent DNA helicase PcrA